MVFWEHFSFPVGQTQQIPLYYNQSPEWKAYCVYRSHACCVIPLLADVCNQKVCTKPCPVFLAQQEFCIVVVRREGVTTFLSKTAHSALQHFFVFQPHSCEAKAAHREGTKERRALYAVLFSFELILATEDRQQVNAQ